MNAVERRVAESLIALLPSRVEPIGVAQTVLEQATIAVIVSLAGHMAYKTMALDPEWVKKHENK
jgi:hypothetical protein